MRVDKMRGYLVASTQRWASCLAHTKVPVRASVSKFPACTVGGVDAKAERSTSGKFHFISRFFPTTFSQACYALNTQARTFSGTTPSSSFLSFQVRLAPPPASWREDTRSRIHVLGGNLTFFNNNPSLRYAKIQSLHSDEMPLGGVATRIGDAFGPALDAIAEHQSRCEPADASKTSEVFVPSIPHALPVTRWARDSEFIRSVLLVDERKRVKPRLSWYDPYDTTWIPNGWFAEGVIADMNYYFADAKAKKP